MSTEQLISFIITGLFLVNLMLPIALAGVSWWCNVSFRTNLHLGRKWQRLKYKKAYTSNGTKWDDDDHINTWGSFDLILALVITLITLLLIKFVNPIVPLIIVFMWGSPFIMRLIVDMFRALQMNYKTGDSERLAKLEAEITRINSKHKEK